MVECSIAWTRHSLTKHPTLQTLWVLPSNKLPKNTVLWWFTIFQKEKKASQVVVQKKSLKSIMDERLMKKRSSPLFSSDGTPQTPCSCGYSGKYQFAKKRYREEENKTSDLEASIKKLKEDREVYLQLNRELQMQLLEKIKGYQGLNVSQTLAKVHTESN